MRTPSMSRLSSVDADPDRLWGRSPSRRPALRRSWTSISNVRDGVDIARAESSVERIDQRRRSAGMARRRVIALPGELFAAAMQRRLYRAFRGGQQIGNLQQREVEHVLQHDGSTLLRCRALEQRSGCGGSDHRGLPGCRFRRDIGRRFIGRLPPAPRVDPRIGRDAAEIGARVRRRLVDEDTGADRTEALEQSLLQQIFGIEDRAGELQAIAVQPRADRRDGVDIAKPQFAERARCLIVDRFGHRSPSLFHPKTAGAGRKIRRGHGTIFPR